MGLPPPTSGVPNASDAPRVLITDDDLDTREALRAILEAQGYGVVEAVEGAATLETLAQSAPFRSSCC
jgi:CheY-like chemotaxis protein